MSFHQIKTPGAELAVKTYTLEKSPTYLDRIQQMGKHLDCLKSPTFRFTNQALVMLNQLTDFDAYHVLKEIASLASNPNPSEATPDPENPIRRLWRCRYPFRNYHYLINFARTSDGGITISDILFDRSRTGVSVPVNVQRNVLYHVKSTNDERYRDVKTIQAAQALAGAWNRSSPTIEIHTLHAAVNGMQNDLMKAQWLMGTHLDVAYPDDKLNEYTLFHNPTDGNGASDVAECLWDKIAPLSKTSCQAQYLSELLWQRQTHNKPTKWVVHSQGAIVFKAAVRHHLAVRPNSLLDKHTVAFHAGGSVMASTRKTLEDAGIQCLLERINPFDFVPNTIARNDLSASGLIRALRFIPKVFNNNGGNPAISPHTLPYLGVCTYYLQLKEGGFHREANTVHNYMNGLNDKQLAYERSLNDPNAHILKNKV